MRRVDLTVILLMGRYRRFLHAGPVFHSPSKGVVVTVGFCGQSKAGIWLAQLVRSSGWLDKVTSLIPNRILLTLAHYSHTIIIYRSSSPIQTKFHF